MVTEKNNMHDVDTFLFFKWFFKAFVAVFLVTHTFDITTVSYTHLKWLDDEGRIYIIYPIAEIAEILDKGSTKFRFHQLPVIAFPGLGILIRPAEYILEKRLDKARLNWYINRAKIK